MAGGIELERVVRTGARGRPSGRIHLTALIPDLGEVRTLCGQRFPAASARRADAPAECQLCLRRRDDPALVSAALFEAGLGARLLELSLAQADERAAERKDRVASRPRLVPAQVRPAASASAPTPARTRGPAARHGELRVTGMQEMGEDLYRSPAGVLVRLRRRGDAWYVAELVHQGPVLLRRRSESRLELRVGDVEIELNADGGRVRAAYALS